MVTVGALPSEGYAYALSQLRVNEISHWSCSRKKVCGAPGAAGFVRLKRPVASNRLVEIIVQADEDKLRFVEASK